MSFIRKFKNRAIFSQMVLTTLIWINGQRLRTILIHTRKTKIQK